MKPRPGSKGATRERVDRGLSVSSSGPCRLGWKWPAFQGRLRSRGHHRDAAWLESLDLQRTGQGPDQDGVDGEGPVVRFHPRTDGRSRWPEQRDQQGQRQDLIEPIRVAEPAARRRRHHRGRQARKRAGGGGVGPKAEPTPQFPCRPPNVIPWPISLSAPRQRGSWEKSPRCLRKSAPSASCRSSDWRWRMTSGHGRGSLRHIDAIEIPLDVPDAMVCDLDLVQLLTRSVVGRNGLESNRRPP